MKRFFLITVVLFGSLVLVSLVLRSPASSESQSQIQQGLGLAPVPLNLQGKNRGLVALGSYIVNAQGACADCHTNPWHLSGSNPFLNEPEQVNAAGYLGGGTAFGPFVTRNLTPDSLGRPAGYTFEEFVQVIRIGTDLKNLPPHVPSAGTDLLQVMPWPVYKGMTDRDLRAIYEYLTSIPCLEGGPGAPPSRCG